MRPEEKYFPNPPPNTMTLAERILANRAKKVLDEKVQDTGNPEKTKEE